MLHAVMWSSKLNTRKGKNDCKVCVSCLFYLVQRYFLCQHVKKKYVFPASQVKTGDLVTAIELQLFWANMLGHRAPNVCGKNVF